MCLPEERSSASPQDPSPLILGHRGASAIAPENTLAAFSLAIQDCADGIEFDVRLSRDHVPVVIHDATLRRTGLTEGVIGELSAQELQEVDVGSWFSSKGVSYSGEKLPRLVQVFDLFASISGLLYIEMKCDPDEGPALAAEVVKLIRRAEMQERVVVESFDLPAIAEVKSIDKEIRTAALFEPRLSKPISTIRPLKMIDVACRHKADEIALHHTLASPRVVERARSEGLEVVVWTVDDREWIARARATGIKALIANNPAAMVQYRGGSE
jgi:glycerophosphoryl diester phosphodiesterase